jgi:hypothetical protein
MGIILGKTRPWLAIAICLRTTPEKEEHHVALLFFPDQRKLTVFIIVYSRVGSLWQLLTIRGGGSIVGRRLCSALRD